jgi:hypothetical protein
MNTKEKLYSRLLESFPVKVLKDSFNLEGAKKNVIIDVLKSNSYALIDNFVKKNFGFTHQHVVVLEMSSLIKSSQNRLLNGSKIFSNFTKRTSSWVYLHNTKLTYFDTLIGIEKELEFLIPVKIETSNKVMKVYYNTLARDISSYFKHKIYPNRAGNLEEEIINEIKLNLIQTIFKYDLNKGVKFLWENDYIDAVVVKNKKSKSVKVERMDESFTFKVQYPKDWVNIMLTPIQKTKFVGIKGVDGMKMFDIDPTKGVLSVSSFSDYENSVENLLDLILQNN